jgi:hypothetical protein
MLPELYMRPIALIAYNYRGSNLQKLKLGIDTHESHHCSYRLAVRGAAG